MLAYADNCPPFNHRWYLLEALCPEGVFLCTGEALYPHVMAREPHRAGKITGMLLELNDEAVLHLLACPADLATAVSPRQSSAADCPPVLNQLSY